MSLTHPWALVLLAAVPFVWWWHRRRRRPATVDVPSLLFLDAEAQVRPARRRALDPELYVALAAAGLVALAATGPVLPGAGAGRTIRAVVSAGAPRAARGYAERVDGELARLRDLLGPDDRLVVVEEPGGDGEGQRPTDTTLLDVAQAGPAAVRFVLTDRARPQGTGAAVHWVSLGDPETTNVGIVAAALSPDGAGFRLFANLQHTGPRARRVALRAELGEGEGERALLDLPAGVSHASHTFHVPRIGLAATLALEDEEGGDWTDDLALDDRVEWVHRPVRVRIAEDLASPTRRALEGAFSAALGRGGFVVVERDVDLAVTVAAPDGPTEVWHLVLHPIAVDGDVAPPVPAGTDVARSDPLVRDLSTVGVDLRYARGAAAAPAGSVVLLARRVGGRTWPVVARKGRIVHFLPDPARGRPSPAGSTVWPLFVDDLLHVAAGEQDEATWGFRRRGLLSAESSRLGLASSPPTSVDLGSFPPDRPATRYELSRPLALLALACLALLWVVPWSRLRRRSPRRSAARPVVSTG